jgi:hypothetical protein
VDVAVVGVVVVAVMRMIGVLVVSVELPRPTS